MAAARTSAGPAGSGRWIRPVEHQVTRGQVLRYRMRAHQLDQADTALGTGRAEEVTTRAVLDLGVQDTGADGALWALAQRRARVETGTFPTELAVVWSVRGAPHVYRRADLAEVATVLRPSSEADAAQRIGAAAGPLGAAGIPIGRALATVAAAMREIVTRPMVKGEVSTRLTAAMGAPYVHWCARCQATHVHEMPFRLGALYAGLELAPGTSPPVLSPVPGWSADHLAALADLPATAAPPPSTAGPGRSRLDPVSAYLHLLGPATPTDVAAHLDAPVRDVTVRFTALRDAGAITTVELDGGDGWILSDDLADLRTPAPEGGRAAAAADRPVVRLLGPFDPFLQARDRALLVPDAERRRAVWPALGRPGVVLHDGDVIGTWRPRTGRRRLAVRLDAWVPWAEAVERAVDEQVERLATHRGLEPAGR